MEGEARGREGGPGKVEESDESEVVTLQSSLLIQLYSCLCSTCSGFCN